MNDTKRRFRIERLEERIAPSRCYNPCYGGGSGSGGKSGSGKKSKSGSGKKSKSGRGSGKKSGKGSAKAKKCK